MQNFDKLAMEYTAAHSALLTETPELHDAWLKTEVGHRFMGYAGKKLVAYTWKAGVYVPLDTFVLTDIQASPEEGLTSDWEDSKGNLISVGHAPVQVLGNCFMWHNHSSSYEYTRRYGAWSFRLSMTLRTERHPGVKEEGLSYMTEESKLEQLGLR